MGKGNRGWGGEKKPEAAASPFYSLWPTGAPRANTKCGINLFSFGNKRHHVDRIVQLYAIWHSQITNSIKERYSLKSCAPSYLSRAFTKIRARLHTHTHARSRALTKQTYAWNLYSNILKLTHAGTHLNIHVQPTDFTYTRKHTHACSHLCQRKNK